MLLFRFALLLWNSSGQGISQVRKCHPEVSILGLTGCYKPRIAREIGKLSHERQGAERGILPEGLSETDRALLRTAVLAARRTGEAIADGFAVCIECNIARDIQRAVVGVDQRVTVGGLKPGDCRT